MTTITENLDTLANPVEFVSIKPQNQLDRWFQTMRAFLVSIPRGRYKVDPKKPSVALIDTAVDIFDKSLRREQIASVVSCELHPTSVELDGSHGTHMAKAIMETAGRHMNPLLVLELQSFWKPSQGSRDYFPDSLAEVGLQLIVSRT